MKASRKMPRPSFPRSAAAGRANSKNFDNKKEIVIKNRPISQVRLDFTFSVI